MIILDGRKAREHYISILKDRIGGLSFVPQLVIIQVGSRADSDSFIKAKKSFAEKIGVKEIHVKLDENIEQDKIIALINKYNIDDTVQGIIVQLPLPSHLDSKIIINKINKEKDTDGLTDQSIFVGATARGVKELLEFYKIILKNKKVTVVGQSKLVGKPIAQLCIKEGAMVTVCDSKTSELDLISSTRSAEILIVAIGKPNFINKKYINNGQIVIDVGITRVGDHLIGDVDIEDIKDIVSMITPVPGGVGQMTVLALFENLIDACYSR